MPEYSLSAPHGWCLKISSPRQVAGPSLPTMVVTLVCSTPTSLIGLQTWNRPPALTSGTMHSGSCTGAHTGSGHSTGRKGLMPSALFTTAPRPSLGRTGRGGRGPPAPPPRLSFRRALRSQRLRQNRTTPSSTIFGRSGTVGARNTPSRSESARPRRERSKGLRLVGRSSNGRSGSRKRGAGRPPLKSIAL